MDLYKQKTDNFAQRFRKLTQTNENDLKVIKVQYDQFQAQYKEDISKLNQHVSECRDKIKSIEQKRMAESQAFAGDIQSVKKRVINFERYIKRLKKHVDDEKTAELITELENTDVAQVDMDQLISDITKIEYEVKAAMRFKIQKWTNF